MACLATDRPADVHQSPQIYSTDTPGHLLARVLVGGRRWTAVALRRAAPKVQRHAGGSVAAVLLLLIRWRWLWVPPSKERRVGITIPIIPARWGWQGPVAN